MPDTWVFWVHASSIDQFQQSYERIASVACIPENNNPKANVLQLVYQWLCDETNGVWLIVLDNADDDTLFFDLDSNLVEFLPQVQHGSILLTSRNRLAATNLVGDSNHVIIIEPMTDDEGLALLRTKTLTSRSPVEDEKALVHALEYIPLAIIQAGSYISSRSTRFTVSKYLQMFNECESHQMQLLDHEDAKSLRRYNTTGHAIITTWQLSFEQIRGDKPAAADLLALMSMFDRQEIPEDLVQEDKGNMQFEDTLAPLLSFALVRVESEQHSFNMHRLVQLAVRKWLENNHEVDRWREKSREIVAKRFPIPEYGNWSMCRRLLSHSKEVIKFSPVNDPDALNTAWIAYCYGLYLESREKYKEAEEMYRQALAAKVRVFGDGNPDIPIVLHLGINLAAQEKSEEAEELFRMALARQEKMHRHKHEDTLAIISNLGTILEARRNFDEAEVMYRRALEGRKQTLRNEHPDIFASMVDVGSVLERQMKYKEAETIYLQALEGLEKTLGHEHSETIECIRQIGFMLQVQQKYEEAEAMYRRALKRLEKVFDHEHPDTLKSIRDLGSVLEQQGKYKEAEEMHRRALDGREKILDHEHPETLESMKDLGSVLKEQGKYKEAEEMYRRALKRQEKVFNHEHPNTLERVKDLGSVLQQQGKYKEAEGMYRRALEGRDRLSGREDAKKLISIIDLGSVLEQQGKYEEAEEMYRQALERQGDALWNDLITQSRARCLDALEVQTRIESDRQTIEEYRKIEEEQDRQIMEQERMIKELERKIVELEEQN